MVMQKFKSSKLPFKMTSEFRKGVIATLFPFTREPLIPTEIDLNPPLITANEIKMAANGLKTGKAPGLDGIPAEAVKELASLRPELVRVIFNKLLVSQKIPAEFKEAKLVLIHKTGKPMDLHNSYRPLCLINSTAKLLETILRDRLSQELEKNGNLSPNQYGFRKGRSTLDALNKVREIAQNAKFHGAGDRWCILLTVDVKNAFNSASWNQILRRLQTKNISKYLIAIIRAYFHERTIVDAGTGHTLTAGIPQGSVIGPLLWNIMYDPILKLNYPDGVEAIGFADDLAAVIVAKTRDELRTRVNETIETISQWMKQSKLSIAPEKTGIVILTGPRARRQFKFKQNGTDIVPAKSVKYLGVTISENMYFAQHVKEVVEKAGKRLQSLNALMPNTKGRKKRRLMYGVLQSTLMYAAQIWGYMMEIEKYKKLIESIQRKALIRTTSAYRTISTKGSQVIAGIPPIDLQIAAKIVPQPTTNAKQWIEEK